MSTKCYDDILPDDGRIFDRVKLWSEFCEKYKTDPLECEINFKDLVDAISEEDSVESSSNSEEFEDNSIPDEKQDPEFDIQKVLNSTLQIMHTREDNWRRNGISQAMNSFDISTSEKVQNWLKENNKYKNCNDFPKSKEPVDKKILMEEELNRNQCSDDESLQSVNTAKYILSNRKKIRSIHCSSTTIKQFCFNRQQSVSNEFYNKRAKDTFQRFKSLKLNSNIKENNLNVINEETPLKYRQKVKLKKRTLHYSYFESSNDSTDQSISSIIHGKKSCYKRPSYKSYKKFNKDFEVGQKHLSTNKNKSSNNKIRNQTTSFQSEIDFDINSIINSTEIIKNKNNKFYQETEELRSRNFYTNDNSNIPCSTCRNKTENKTQYAERVNPGNIYNKRNKSDKISKNLKRRSNNQHRSFKDSNESFGDNRSCTLNSSNISSFDSDKSQSRIESFISKRRKTYFQKQRSEQVTIFDRSVATEVKDYAQIVRTKKETASRKKDKNKKQGEEIIHNGNNQAGNREVNDEVFGKNTKTLKEYRTKKSRRLILISSTESSENSFSHSRKNSIINLRKCAGSMENNRSGPLKTLKNENTLYSSESSSTNMTSVFSNPKNNENVRKVKKLKWKIHDPKEISETSNFENLSKFSEPRVLPSLQTLQKHKSNILEKEKLLNLENSNQAAVHKVQETNKLINCSKETKGSKELKQDKADIESYSENSRVIEEAKQKPKNASFHGKALKNELDVIVCNKNEGSKTAFSKITLLAEKNVNNSIQTPKNLRKNSINRLNKCSDSINSYSNRTPTLGKLSSDTVTEQHIVLYDPKDDTIKQFDTGKIVIDESLLKQKLGVELMKKFLKDKKTYKRICDSDSRVIFVLPNEKKGSSSSDSEEDDLDKIFQENGDQHGKIVELFKYKKA
ncbi:putative uncharacterized protein DDB_G0282133 [Condylostylus longicornis]|uniref:putative uncharacterized protein DDB_G0282133 n=1 Tax=Condylostylus longicornis TaxID=2530218 RepID=UPI00244DE950|nr:putative uncharacterized protein DDB_G0282133 [Condylostylus longicornis]